MSRSRTIVITGVSRGLGRALVTGFIKQGNTVAGCARSQAGIAELSGRWPARHHFCPVDITDETAVGKWCEYVIQNVGTPDILINNAAIINRNAELWKVPPEEFRQLVDVNICGIYNVLRHFLPTMIQRKSGIIANFSSTWGADNLSRSRSLLCVEVGRGRFNAKSGERASPRFGGHRRKPWRYQYGHAP